MTDTKEPDKSENSTDSKSENTTDSKSENTTDSKSEITTDSKSENTTDSKSEITTDSKTESSEQQQPNYEFDGKNYVYKDPTTNVTYKFDQEKNDWVVKEEEEESNTSEVKGKVSNPTEPSAQGVFGFENDTHTYTDPNDGSAYFWDKEKNAWFPKVDDDFMARYQMSYGFVEPDDAQSKLMTQPPPPTEPPNTVDKEQKKQEAKRKAQEPPTWFEVDEAHNTAIYVSGLPLDITMEELTELCAKCGLIARDEKGKDRIKLYKDSNGEPKGDALCIYIKVESVDLALKILNKWPIRGKTLSVQRAKFQMKGTYDPALKPKRKKKDKDRQKKIQEKLLDWRPDRLRGEPQKCERVVILKNLFSPEDFDKEVSLLLEYQQDIRSECLKCGDVRKVVLYDRHPEGVAQVTFREPAEAQACIQLLNGRWFSQRKISAAIWDGKTKYKIHETDAEIEARIAKWDKYLEDEEEEKKDEKNSDRSSDSKKSVKGSPSRAGSAESSVGKTEPSVGKSNYLKPVKTSESSDSTNNSDESA